MRNQKMNCSERAGSIIIDNIKKNITCDVSTQSASLQISSFFLSCGIAFTQALNMCNF